ncbi:ATP-binding protein [Inquilinus limosus]|uniref:ATP-binding protein n=1 Tax=Inquilinus limosus TaxID=171674 RepID=UPI003F150267
MSPSRTVPVKPYFGGFVLETLTVGMYGESRNAIREYVQNAFDSIQRSIEELNLLRPGDGLIRIIFDEDLNGLAIRDNGAGLPVRIASETLTSIGASRKDYTTDAGFRGIGRLAGIVFSDTVTFTTKSTGEAEQTQVVFDAREMRKLMAPARASELTAEELLTRCVSVTISEVDPEIPSFFEVKLKGFSEAPDECSQPKLMERFLSQVAPAPYGDSFNHREDIREFGKKVGISIEEVDLVIEQVGEPDLPIFKPFTNKYEVQDAPDLVPLSEIEFFEGESRRWWAWLGKKSTPGSYIDSAVRGIRMRAKNIQIDGEDVVREIFQKLAKSNARYQDWFVGEIFVDLKAVTPNARRDGFEDTAAWRQIRTDISKKVCAEAGRSAQSVSNQGQLTLQKLSDRTERFNEELESLRRNNFRNTDKTLTLSADVTKLQKEVARASRNADPEAQAALQHLSFQLVDMKTEAVSRVAAATPSIDRESVEQEARQELLAELMSLFEDRLPAPCLAAVRNLIREQYDWPLAAGRSSD